MPPCWTFPDGRVRLIGNFGVGYNHIDVAAARTLGIRVSNTPDVLTDTTAELAILLLLMATRRAGEGERELRGGRWTGWRPTHLMGTSLAGKRLGLIGFGRIAQATARKAQAAFGMQIALQRPAPRGCSDRSADRRAVHRRPSMNWSRAPMSISLHCPGGAETFHLMNAARLALMQPTAVLINTARGPVVDEAALVDALAAKRIAAAGLDVYEEEPRVHPGLLQLENVVLLPHLGSATVETRTAMGMRVAAQPRCLLRRPAAARPGGLKDKASGWPTGSREFLVRERLPGGLPADEHMPCSHWPMHRAARAAADHLVRGRAVWRTGQRQDHRGFGAGGAAGAGGPARHRAFPSTISTCRAPSARRTRPPRASPCC